MAVKLSGLLALLLLAGCDQTSGKAGTTVDYRPGEAGTVDHALCLLGFSAVPVRAVEPGHHLISATIDGETSYFVLDTGANVTVLDRSRAERLGLSFERRAPMSSGKARPAGAGRAEQVPIGSFQIGSIRVRQGQVVTADLGQLLGALEQVSGVQVAGIIGQDVLREHRAIIDVAQPRLYLMEEDQDPAPVAAELCQSPQSAAPG